jgi:4-methylaminobutanoate oxidase (formaldehyde-forming)
MAFSVDRHTRILIIGGGAIGCALAYHLGLAGAKDVTLLEKSQLTDGCTWHAAGLVGQLRGKRNLTRLMQNSVAVFDALQGDIETPIDWKKVGSLRLAGSPERWSEIRRSMTQAKSFGFDCHAVSVAEAKDMFPFIETEGIVGATFIPGDGYVDPYALTQAFARVARTHGVAIEEGVTVKDIIVEDRRAVGVVTDKGSIGCDILVNCAGLWAKRVGELAGVSLAAGVVEHQYFVTEKTLEFEPTLPTLRDPDNNFYLKPDVAAFAIGGWEDDSKGCWRGRPPLDFGRELFGANMERLELFALPCATRLPVLNHTGIQTVINGPIPVSADGEPIMGLAPELDNFFVACGFTAGIAASGGAGLALANWILEGDPGMDLWAFDVRRFGAQHAGGRFLEERAVDAYGSYYKVHWPGLESTAARGARRSPIYGALKDQGAVYGSKAGWERPNWFAHDGVTGEVSSFEGKPNWFAALAAESEAISQRVALIDQTSFSKFEICGPDAFNFLQHLAANDLSGGPGRCVYTQLCNDRGGIEADLTIMQLEDDLFYVVTGSGFGVRDANWITRHMPRDGSITMREVTSAYAVINICGPRARDVLQSVSDDDISAEEFPFLSVRTIEIGLGRARAARVGYVGELGWELHIPAEHAAHVYECLMTAGKAHGIANAGYRVIDSLRLEKGYLYWSSDVGPDYTPYEAGLGFCVALGKGEFIGRDALAAQKRDGVARKLCAFTVDGFAPFHGGEAILHEGEVVGMTTSAGYGHRIGKSIALGYLPTAYSGHDEFDIEAFGTTYPARRGPRCHYDAAQKRLKS